MRAAIVTAGVVTAAYLGLRVLQTWADSMDLPPIYEKE